jgi:acyl transferase domain-containing protein/acyl carrier protein
MSGWDDSDHKESLDVAIIGMSGRFPGAKNLDEFWRNLSGGVESITSFSDEQLRAFGVDAAAIADARFVKAGAILEGVELFDASFFGYSPKEAELMDPQHRVFLECAWQAFEDAGYDPTRYAGPVGVFAGTSMSTYLLYNLLTSQASTTPDDSFQLMIGNDKDFLTTRVSYKLNLKGPSIDVQTGCSTSLVAVHLACQSLLSYQCDMALAGGISIQVPKRTGYFYQEGGINSPDGHCRAFDANAQGTIFGSGVGIVILKRLTEALADGDNIQAVIKGSAINNDGAAKIGYTAPGVDGQAQVVALAQLVAGVAAETISYIEAHGTGTALGDPVEIAALTKAFRASTKEKGFCALGSVKTNLGHLDAAAGIAGLIKTVLALKHRQLPASLHFQEANPKIDFAASPFYVNTQLQGWAARGGVRRAGVSSFGIGGTNAHVIVEEALPIDPSGPSRTWKVLTLSAKKITSLDRMTLNLAQFLRESPDVNLSDVAYTLQMGRAQFNHRRVIIATDNEDAIETIESLDPQKTLTVYQEPERPAVVFMFPGGGAQYINMAAGLYRHEPEFRRHLDLCGDLLRPLLGFDLRPWLYPTSPPDAAAQAHFDSTLLALPALFAVEYSLAQLLMSWGIRPQAMIGHSLGEYVAACLAGVFSLEAALQVVVTRARLFAQLRPGGMLSVGLTEEEVRAELGESVSIAAINGPRLCVVSGSQAAIAAAAQRLAEKGLEYRRLHIDVAAHSQEVEPILESFRGCVEGLRLQVPQVGVMSNRTGKWAGAEMAEAEYWVRHLRESVRFWEGLEEMRRGGERVLVEVGPGQSLSTIAKLSGVGDGEVVTTMRHVYQEQSDEQQMSQAVGKLWGRGVGVVWEQYYKDEGRRRVSVVGYGFAGQRYWIEGRGKVEGGERGEARGKRSEVGEWYYERSWQRRRGARRGEEEVEADEGKGGRKRWLVLKDEEGIGEEVVRGLAARGEEVVEVRRGERYEEEEGKGYRLRSGAWEDYEELVKELQRRGFEADEVVHLWSVTGEAEAAVGLEFFRRMQERGFYSLLFLAQAIANQKISKRVNIWVVSNGMQDVEGAESFYPEKATLLGPCKVIPQENENLACCAIDISVPRPNSFQRARLIEQLITEIDTKSSDAVIAYRGGKRLVQTYERLHLDGYDLKVSSPLRKNGVYLITGGLGGIGLLLAEYLARTTQARLVLVGRSRFPEKQDWQRELSIRSDHDELSRKIRKLQALEALGAELLVVSANVADPEQLDKVIASTYEQFGALHGVIHAAGLAGEKAVRLIPEASRDETEKHFEAKAYGLYALEKVLAGRPPDFCLLFSSNAAVLGGLGSISYSAANLFMDAFATSVSNYSATRWISANWDGWLVETGDKLSASFQTSLDQYAMTPEEGCEAFRRIISMPTSGNLVVSTGDLAGRLRLWITREDTGTRDRLGESDAAILHPRPSLGNAYAPPSNETEQIVVKIWQELLGIKELGIHDNFFDLGGNSLIGLKVISRLKRELGIDIPVVALFEGPTVSALAKVVGTQADVKPHFELDRDRGARRREKRRSRSH